MKQPRKLILEDGNVYEGYGFGGSNERVCEIVFNTSMAGYQEIISDPSYTDQGIVMSYPLIGNYGITDDDFESRKISPSAFIIRDLNENPSNFRATMSVSELLEESGVPGIFGVDTRAIVRNIRNYGSQRGLITDEDISLEEGLKIINETPVRKDAVKRVSCKKKSYVRTSNPRFQVVAIDCGMKTGIVRMFKKYKCNVTIVPYDTSYEEILALSPDGVFVSNGPGDPTDVGEVIDTLKHLRGIVPIFGICLGHQLLSLSYGAKTYKLKFGHRGGNHPVKDIQTGRIEITSQNHSYAVDDKSIAGTELEVTHINILDGTIEGIQCERDKVFSVQYHPESAPGPQDSRYLFERFANLMEKNKN